MRELESIPEGPAIIATGPLTSESLSRSIAELVGEGFLFFFDAVSPVVSTGSIDMTRAWRGSRYGSGDDYINCPMTREEYEEFQKALASAEKAPRHDFEKEDRTLKAASPLR